MMYNDVHNATVKKFNSPNYSRTTYFIVIYLENNHRNVNLSNKKRQTYVCAVDHILNTVHEGKILKFNYRSTGYYFFCKN